MTLHNSVNTRLGKLDITWEKVMDMYFAAETEANLLSQEEKKDSNA